MDGSREASTLKRSQLAQQRRARIRAAIAAGSATFGFDGKPIDPLADQPDEIEQEWTAQYGDGDNGGDAA
ncbi:hypothetical protein [Gordonia sp. NPDC003376]